MGGGDKAMIPLAGKTMLDRVVDRLAPQVDRVVLNANGDPARFAAYRLPVIADTIEGFAGPLAGILAGMRWAQANLPSTRFVASAAADTPFFPANLVAQLHSHASEETIALATSPDGTHPVFGLWPVALADDLETFLNSGQGGKILAFVDRHRRADVRFEPLELPGLAAFDPFFNVNTPEDAAAAEAIAAALDRQGG
jgi:molybdopterin-guanine dinucleotide biosynthesis protein A